MSSKDAEPKIACSTWRFNQDPAEGIAAERLLSKIASTMHELETDAFATLGRSFAEHLGPIIGDFCNVPWFAIYRAKEKGEGLSLFTSWGIGNKELPEDLSAKGLQPSCSIEPSHHGCFEEIGEEDWIKMCPSDRYSHLTATRFAFWENEEKLGTLFLYGPVNSGKISLLETDCSKRDMFLKISAEMSKQIDVSLSHVKIGIALKEREGLIEKYRKLHDEFGKMGTLSDENGLLNAIVTGLVQLGYPSVRVYLHEPITKTLRSAACSGLAPKESQHFQNGGYSFDHSTQATWKAIDTRSLVFCSVPSHPDVARRLGFTPSRGSSHRIGRLSVYCEAPDVFGFHET